MNLSVCLSASQLIRYQAGQDEQQERELAERHLRECGDCQQHLSTAKHFDRLLEGKGWKMRPLNQADADRSDCLSEDLIYRYLDKALTDAERDRVREHLNRCSFCFQEVSSLARDVLSPATEAEQTEMARLSSASSEGPIARILACVRTEEQSLDAQLSLSVRND
jgi:hypothetical protein